MIIENIRLLTETERDSGSGSPASRSYAKPRLRNGCYSAGATLNQTSVNPLFTFPNSYHVEVNRGVLDTAMPSLMA